jgi:hypothetical protein
MKNLSIYYKEFDLNYLYFIDYLLLKDYEIHFSITDRFWYIPIYQSLLSILKNLI